jgi:hypothetical protein
MDSRQPPIVFPEFHVRMTKETAGDILLSGISGFSLEFLPVAKRDPCNFA